MIDYDRIRHSYLATENERLVADNNLVQTMQPLPQMHSLQMLLPVDMLEPDYINGNSAIHPIDDGYLVLQRCSNYRIVPAHLRPDQIHTKNVWIALNNDFSPRAYCDIDHSLVDRISYNPLGRMKIIGLEDARFFEFQDRWWFIAGSNHFEMPMKGVDRWGQVLCRIHADGESIDYVRPLRYRHATKVEKNWLPFVMQDTVYVVYSYAPFIILRVDTHSGGCDVSYRQMGQLRFDNYRGSGTPIRYQGKWLFTIHEVRRVVGHRFIYNHRFVEMDDDFTITRLSETFYFRHKGVEYTCGHCLSNDGTKLLLTYSSEDKHAHLLWTPLDVIESLLHPLDYFQLDEESV